jgi:hypothetical protein
MAHDPIQALWIGPRLSTLGRLTIESFLALGYEFHLYGYQSIANTPPGTRLCDAREIYAQSEVFVYRRGAGKGSPSAFSNMFRYRLLELRGGWWSDLDVVCLRRLEFEAEHVFGSERTSAGGEGISNALMRVPAGSPLMRYCREVAEQADRRTIRWGQVGPQLVTRAVAEVGPTLGEQLQLLPPDTFSPIDYWEIERLINDQQLPSQAHAIHLFNEMWRRKGIDPDRRYNSDCIYEQLIRRYLSEQDRPPVRDSWLRGWFKARRQSA